MDETRLKQVLADIFDIDAETIDETTSIDTIEEWDSLRHLYLVLALEAELDITLTEEQTIEILSYPQIKAVVQEQVEKL